MIPVDRIDEMPRTWATVGCLDCDESWTVDTAEWQPALRTGDVERLLGPELDSHRCEGAIS